MWMMAVLSVYLGVASAAGDANAPQAQGHRRTQQRISSTLEVLQGAGLYSSRSMLCGPTCLYVGAQYLGIRQYSLDDIAEMADWDPIEGTSMLGLYNACRAMSLYAQAVEVRVPQLRALMKRSHALAVVGNRGHFYLLTKADEAGFFCVGEPPKTAWVDDEKLAGFWNGKALLFSKTPLDTHLAHAQLWHVLPCIGGGCLIVAGVLVYYLGRRRRTPRLSTRSTANP
jgi:hypothetical protein